MKARVMLTIDPEVWHRFRVQALERKTSASAVLEKLMRAQIDKWTKDKQ